MVTVMIVLIGLAAFSAFYREAKFSGGEVFCHSIEAVQRTGGWEAMFAYDTLIFLLALWKAFKTRRAPRIPLLAVLIRDGAAYFGAMSLANLANILTLYFTDSETRGFMEYMTSYISVTLTSRMMLRLHQAADTTHAESMAMTMDTIRFNAVRTGFSEDSTEATSVTGNES
ncbi:hypothetical protein MPER_10825 [Moniliophthora perniciosa FA553]|nr:hypothetical protein MPER_10825 [Moniliophthora perniciosa FA553]